MREKRKRDINKRREEQGSVLCIISEHCFFCRNHVIFIKLLFSIIYVNSQLEFRI